MTGLAGKVVLITGGNSGIGRAAAHKFAAAGANVMIAARDLAASGSVVAEIATAGGVAGAVVCDVTDPIACQAAVDRCVDDWGRLDVLFNNAGVIFRGKSTPETSDDEWATTLGVNTTGTFFMSRAAIPAMIEQGSGVIVNNASYFGLVGGRGVAAYAASKGAVVLLTKAMALDHAHQGIRVNCVCPGSVDTPMLHREMADMGDAEKARHLFGDKHPLGRIASPDEIAAAVLYLASDEAGFVTGVALPVDGGLTAG